MGKRTNSSRRKKTSHPRPAPNRNPLEQRLPHRAVLDNFAFRIPEIFIQPSSPTHRHWKPLGVVYCASEDFFCLLRNRFFHSFSSTPLHRVPWCVLWRWAKDEKRSLSCWIGTKVVVLKVILFFRWNISDAAWYFQHAIRRCVFSASERIFLGAFFPSFFMQLVHSEWTMVREWSFVCKIFHFSHFPGAMVSSYRRGSGSMGGAF